MLGTERSTYSLLLKPSFQEKGLFILAPDALGAINFPKSGLQFQTL